jgi:phosphoglycolate phosphatase
MNTDVKMPNPNKDGQIQAEMAENARQMDTFSSGKNAAPTQAELTAIPVASAEDIAAAAGNPTTVAAQVEAKKIRYRAKPKFPIPVPAKVLLIDLDGTLVDSAGDIATAANRMRAAFGFGALDIAVIRNFIGRGIAHLVAQSMKGAVGELGATSSKVAVAQFEKQYETCLADTSRAYPGVFEGLELMKEKGFKLGCVTNKAERFALPLLEKTALAPYFSLVICGDTLAEKKPHPLPIEHAARHFQVKLEEVVMIGDSMHDAAAARAAGCPVFIVTYGYNEGQELRGLDCDAFIDDLPTALKYVKVVA